MNNRAIRLMGKIVENPDKELFDIGKLVRLTAIKDTTVSVHAGGIPIGEARLLAKQSVDIAKQSSETITCPDSVGYRIKYEDM